MNGAPGTSARSVSLTLFPWLFRDNLQLLLALQPGLVHLTVALRFTLEHACS